MLLSQVISVRLMRAIGIFDGVAVWQQSPKSFALQCCLLRRIGVKNLKTDWRIARRSRLDKRGPRPRTRSRFGADATNRFKGIGFGSSAGLVLPATLRERGGVWRLNFGHLTWSKQRPSSRRATPKSPWLHCHWTTGPHFYQHTNSQCGWLHTLLATR